MVGSAYDMDEGNVKEEAAEVAKLLKASLKSKDTLLKAVKVGAAPRIIGHRTGLGRLHRAPDVDSTALMPVIFSQYFPEPETLVSFHTAAPPTVPC